MYHPNRSTQVIDGRFAANQVFRSLFSRALAKSDNGAQPTCQRSPREATLAKGSARRSSFFDYADFRTPPLTGAPRATCCCGSAM